MWKIIEMQKTLEEVSVNAEVSKKLLYRAKRIGFSDRIQQVKCWKKTEIYVRDLRENCLIKPSVPVKAVRYCSSMNIPASLTTCI